MTKLCQIQTLCLNTMNCNNFAFKYCLVYLLFLLILIMDL